MTSPLILDTSGWLLGLAGEAPFADAIEAASSLYVPGLVLAELDYHLRHQRRAMHRVLSDIDAGAYAYEPPTVADLARASVIDRKFSNLELGLTDSTIVALAERLGVFRLLTSDSDFVAVRAGPRWNRALELIVHPKPRHS